MVERDYEKLYNKYKSKYLLLTRKNNTYVVTKIDKLQDDSEINNNNTPDWPSISNKVRASVVQIYSISYTIDPENPYILPANELGRGSGFVI